MSETAIHNFKTKKEADSFITKDIKEKTITFCERLYVYIGGDKEKYVKYITDNNINIPHNTYIKLYNKLKLDSLNKGDS